MNINYKVRFKNKAFWVAFIPTVFLLAQQILALFGISFDFTGIAEQLVSIAGTVFAVLALLGVVNDPTTKGLNDSERALGYDEPR